MTMIRGTEFHMSGKPVLDGMKGGKGSWIALLACLLSFSFGLTCVYLAGRGVMRQGGFVAVGGPYEIAHHAADWVWIFPVAIFLMMIPIFVTIFALSSRIRGPSLMSLSWSAVFLALGWNFIEFGFGIGMGGTLAWGWVICAVFFVLMGLIPLVLILRSFSRALRERMSGPENGYVKASFPSGEVSWTASLLGQLLVAASGVILGIFFFRSIS